MVTLVASTFISNGSLWLYLDNKLIIQNSDSVSVELEEGQDYIIHWFVQGEPGNPYSITISAPREAQFQLTRAMVKSKKDFGAYRFSS
jgi:hypothetical protein